MSKHYPISIYMIIVALLATFFTGTLLHSFASASIIDQKSVQDNLQYESRARDLFQKRFTLVRNENGELEKIVDKTLITDFSIRPIIDFIANELIAEQKKMRTQKNYKAKMKSVFGDELKVAEEETSEDIQERRLDDIFESLDEVSKLDIQKIFNNKEFKEVISYYEQELTKNFRILDLNTMSNLTDPTYFYYMTVNYTILTWALDFARDRLSSVPLLNVAAYVLKRVDNLFRERRVLHQNMLMHYFENFKAENFGMTDKEVDRAFSSIYESRIAWFGYFESLSAQDNWDRYGIDKFFVLLRSANTNLREVSSNYDSLGSRINFAFQDVVYNGENVIINLFDKDHMFSKMPSIAYSYDDPNKIKNKRMIIQLIQLGLSFTTLPDSIKSGADSFFNSMYVSQKLTEGSLLAHLEIVGNENLRKEIFKNQMNPFENY